jgi:hypothetical protein
LALLTAQPLELLIIVSDSSLAASLPTDIEVHHVVRLVEQHGAVLPGPLFAAPVGEFGGDHRIDIGTQLRIAQHVHNVALPLRAPVRLVAAISSLLLLLRTLRHDLAFKKTIGKAYQTLYEHKQNF